MSTIVVGLSDMRISVVPEDVLVTYSLGSCIGVSAYDPKARIGGLIHCLLPLPGEAPDGERDNPFKFVTTGIPVMVRRLVKAGADQRRLVFKGAGGASIRSQYHVPIGAENAKALRGVLAYNNARLTAEEFGGTIPRTMFLYLDTGRVVIRTKGVPHDLV
ncbi:chemotaxis protein CheD [uncultured Pseudodesulfovibrio sp.]|uniref:chemotaxis protein CheD n=1 Tax=uncultured Pseudodesulfovibrio sp. TaxID=2035858 RepID=UPI0029C74BF9|nr:chemotaxis protein CheD [uncultured Pseudodesulfovibrio sp.]